nr:hypothetical protein Iba_chr02bCG3670 [Ipomoea batatas]GMC62419.1 hypothetical protein Iba_chr02cCG3610 [Ipomoea batatas]
MEIKSETTTGSRDCREVAKAHAKTNLIVFQSDVGNLTRNQYREV